MRPTVALAVTVILCSGLAGCLGGNQTKRDAPSAAEKSAEEKVKEALAAQQAEEEKHRAEVRAAAASGKLASINNICPVTGDPVDPAIAPVTIEVMLVSPSEILAIGVATEAAAEAVRRDPDRYAAAAKRNRQARSTTTVGR
jgi:hypothetical protein